MTQFSASGSFHQIRLIITLVVVMIIWCCSKQHWRTETAVTVLWIWAIKFATVLICCAFTFTSIFHVSVLLDRFPWSSCQLIGLIDMPPLARIPQHLEAVVIHCEWEQYYSSSESFHSSDMGMAKPFTLALLLWRVAALYVKSCRPFHWWKLLGLSISNVLHHFLQISLLANS